MTELSANFVALRALMRMHGWEAIELTGEIYTGVDGTRVTFVALGSQETKLIIPDVWAEGVVVLRMSGMSYGLMTSLALHAAMVARVAYGTRTQEGNAS